MSKILSSAIKHGFTDSLPVAFGYIPLGIAFGFLFEKLIFHWYLGVLMSVFVFAGAAQFIAISILRDHGSLLTILISTLVVNLRHIFYGVSFVGKFPKNGLVKNYMIFGLTDEAYAILTTSSRTFNNTYGLSVIFLSHFYWIFGTLIGAIIGSLINENLQFLYFSLPALFIIMTIEQAIKVKTLSPFLTAFICSAIALLFPSRYFLVIAIGLSSLVFVLDYMMKDKHHAC